MKLVLPIRARARGMLTLGPKPGTPEFEEEQRCKAAGVPYDYSGCKQLVITDEVPNGDPERCCAERGD